MTEKHRVSTGVEFSPFQHIVNTILPRKSLVFIASENSLGEFRANSFQKNSQGQWWKSTVWGPYLQLVLGHMVSRGV